MRKHEVRSSKIQENFAEDLIPKHALISANHVIILYGSWGTNTLHNQRCKSIFFASDFKPWNEKDKDFDKIRCWK